MEARTPSQSKLEARRWCWSLFQGIRPYDRSRLTADILAGITLAAMNIPQAIGYTKIAGMPPVTGLYTLLLPLVAFAMFGASRYLVVAADSATAAMVVLVGVEQGIVLALVLSLLQHMRRSYQPHTAVILRDPTDEWRMEKAIPSVMIEPGLVIYWFGTELFYANASHLAEEARRLVKASPTPVR